MDVEPRQPVALLPDRTAEPVAQWLQAHPGVEGIARDRSRAYAEGARQGASAAIQVADRFHGLHHLREALDHVFTTSPQACDAVNALERQQPVLLPDGVVAVPVPPPAAPWGPGCAPPIKRICASAGMPAARLPCGSCPRAVSAAMEEALAGGRPLPAGCVRRRASLLGTAARVRPPWPAVAEPPWPPLTPRRAPWLGRRRAAKRTEAEAQPLTRLHAQAAESAEAIARAQDCAPLIRQRQPAQLDPWLQRATASAVDAGRRGAPGLYEDDEAVKAGVTLPWSSGPVEGPLNRLKMLKRHMFGRARLELLSRRFVGASRGDRAPAAGQRAPAQDRAAAA